MNSFSSPRFRLGWILVAIGFANALCWLFFRWNFENHYTTAQITLDFDDTRTAADAAAVPQGQLLDDLRKAGATSLALYNQSLVSLRDNGRIAITPREEAMRIFSNWDWEKIPGRYRYFITSTPENQPIMRQIWPRLLDQGTKAAPPLQIENNPETRTSSVRHLDGINFAFADGHVKTLSSGLTTATPSPPKIPFAIALPSSRELFSDAQMGFDPFQVSFVQKHGYIITARVSNPLNLTPARVETMMHDIAAAGAKTVIFSSDEVLGYQSLISPVARALREHHIAFGSVEFSKQRGSDEFSKMTDGQIVRVHSVTGDEAAKAKPEVLVDRFVRAVKERDIRVAYIRLITQLKGEPAMSAAPGILGRITNKITGAKPEEAPKTVLLEKTAYKQNVEFVHQIAEELGRQALPIAFLRPGLQMGAAEPLGNYPISTLEEHCGPRLAKVLQYLGLFLTGVGVVGAVLLLLNLFFDWTPAAQKFWLVLGLVIVAVLSLSTGKTVQIMALVAGICAPVVAVMWGGLPQLWDGIFNRKTEPKTPGAVAVLGLQMLWKTTLLTLIGGVFVVGLLNTWQYMSKAEEFLGEKATQFVPLFLIPFAFAGELFPHRVQKTGARAGMRRAATRFQNFLAQPFTVRTAIVGMLMLALGFIWMSRFGNESGMEISSFELSMRAILEKIFITRPRTKEIYMGFPAFLFVVMFLLRRQRPLAFGALVLAVIGQTDVLNSMCHIHTPVFYCLWRTFAALILGGFIGWLAVQIYGRIFPAANSSAPGQISTENGV